MAKLVVGNAEDELDVGFSKGGNYGRVGIEKFYFVDVVVFEHANNCRWG